MKNIVDEIIKEIRSLYSYQRTDGSIGIRLQGMRAMIAIKTGSPAAAVITADKNSATGKLIRQTDAGPIKFEETCLMSEFRIPNDPYWEKMPVTCLKATVEARLYRRAYPTLCGHGYSETESALHPRNVTGKSVAKTADFDDPPKKLRYKKQQSWIPKDWKDRARVIRITQIGDIEKVTMTLDDGEIVNSTDPELIDEARRVKKEKENE